jgi:hopene-associated glycosyltransferase HpnB
MIFVAGVALLAWIWLLLFNGRFWQSGPMLAASAPRATPAVDIVVPARDEADMIARSIGSLLAQDYPGPLRVVLVDDGSGDGTADIARALPAGRHSLEVVTGAPRPAGWAGKLWAVHQGVSATDAPLVLMTDADIEHDPAHVATLVAQADRSGADMVSEMVALNCESFAERALIPAFVYFFALLYPFAWVNDARRTTAAAAGGTVLIRRAALERIGGISAIRGALIDDVALAREVKRGGPIWLGHSCLGRSIRPYPDFADVWRMVARSAYVQLRTSPLLLAGMILGLALVFLVPPVAAVFGEDLSVRCCGIAAWLLMAALFVATLRRFGLSWLWALAMPLIACFYMAATIGSAVDHHRGRGVVWKQRAYTESRT